MREFELLKTGGAQGEAARSTMGRVGRFDGDVTLR